MLDVRITDNDTGNVAKVTSNGEVVTASIAHSEPYYVSLDVQDVVYNVVPARVNKQFIITGIFIAANKQIAADTIIQLYESLSDDGGVDKSILVVAMTKSTQTILMPLSMISGPTRWINAIADDRVIDITVFGYYVDGADN